MRVKSRVRVRVRLGLGSARVSELDIEEGDRRQVDP